MNEFNGQPEKPNAPGKWAAAHDEPMNQELPAAPLERLVGQGTERDRQKGICIDKTFGATSDQTQDDVCFEFRDVILTLKTRCPKSISYDSDNGRLIVETKNGLWSGLV